MGEIKARGGRIALAAVLGAAATQLLPSAAWAGAGDLDQHFGAGNVVPGQVTTAFSSEKDAVYALALQPDGKIVAVGDSGTKIALARYRPDGTLDPAFGKQGKIITAVGTLAEGRAVALQPDGKIVVAGYNVDPWSGTNFTLLRFTANGKSDATFGYDGEVVTRISSKADTAYAVAVQSDGKIVAAGSSGDKIAVARYAAAGKLDEAFGKGGSVTTGLKGSAQGSAVALQPDGKIVVAGTRSDKAGSDFAVVRLDAKGALDTGFGAKGSVITDFGTKHDAARSVLVSPDGKLVVAGVSGTRMAVACYKPDGSPDLGFGDKGRAVTEIGTYAEARAAALQKDGKIVLAGYESSPDNGDSVAVVRYSADGKPDSAFGQQGVATSDFGTPSDRGHALVIQPDGNIVVGGRSHSPVLGDNFALTRLLGS